MKSYLLIFAFLLSSVSLLAQAPTISSLSVTGSTIKWYNASSGGTQYTDPANTALVNGQTYYASQTVNGVESTTRLPVTASVNPLPAPSFSTQPGATANINTDVTYTTQSGKSNYVWTFPGAVSTDYTITSGGTNTDNTVTLKYVTNGSKTVSINYTYNGCTAASATSSTPTVVSMIPPGNALALDGNDDFVNAGNNASVQISQGTLEAWIKTPNAGDSYRGIIVKQFAYALFLMDNVLIAFQWTGGQGEISTGIHLADNRWHHVALCFDNGVNNGSFIYIDGELAKTFTFPLNNQSVALGIGNGSVSSGIQNFQGSMDEVRVWNTVRTQAQLQSTLYTELAGNESNLVAYYNCNEGVAGGDNTAITILNDNSGHGINGALTNFAKTGTTSNFVESYALVVPVPAAATSLTGTGFIANWAAPAAGTVSSYKLDVSTSSTFDSFIDGYESLDCGTNLSQAVSGLTAGTTYYYRVRADKTSVTGSGGYYRTPATLTTLTLPTLAETTAVTSITGATASSGGNITSNGGASITARGVCWSTTTSPTADDSKTSDGSGSGIFTSDITGLTATTTYYVRAYATNSVGTNYGSEVSFTTATPLPAIGGSYQGGVLAYILVSGDPGYNASVQHGLIATTSDVSASYWGCLNIVISGADGIVIGTGNQNTLDIVAGCATAGIAASLCNDLTSGGYSDWYLPSKDELYKLYLNQGLIGGFSSAEYWSSTEESGYNAFVVNFGSGNMTGKAKVDAVKPSRAIRSF